MSEEKNINFEFNAFGINFLLEIELKRSAENGRAELVVMKKIKDKSFPFATISQDMPEVEIGQDEFVVNNWDVYKELNDYLIQETEYFINTGRKVNSKYGESPIWKINF